MTARPLISCWNPDSKNTVSDAKKIPLPAVFTAPVRLDIVQFVHTNLNKNRRQAHGVNVKAGMKHSAESWGTGRAVARIPRVGGSGTHRSGQAAFGNMCRKGRMFAPLKVWRRWNRRVNIKQKRHAVASALAASAILPLVIARGHRVNNIPELPLVFDDKIEKITKTRDAVAFLKRAGAFDDVQKVVDTKTTRAGKGKLRSRRYNLRKGPLIVYSAENAGLLRAVRNIPGVEVCNVNRLNLLQLAPGGQLGRFIIWTRSAFAELNTIFGNYRGRGDSKSDYQLQRTQMVNPDLARLINSNEIQEAIRPAKKNIPLHSVQHKNPLTNNTTLFKLNPNAKLVKEAARKQNDARQKQRADDLAKKRGFSKSLTKDQHKTRNDRQKASKKWIKAVRKQILDADNKVIGDYKANMKEDAEDGAIIQ